MLATYAASRHRQIVPCCMISSVSHDNVSCLVTDRSMCFATALDKAFENIDCMSVILRCQAKNRFYESTQRLIQPRRVLWEKIVEDIKRLDEPVSYNRCWRQAYELLCGLYSTERFRENLRMFYRGEYTFP